MNNDYNNPAFKKLLQKLQEESWQLELLISGFAILGLFSALDPLEILLIKSQTDENGYLQAATMILLLSVFILIFNLTFHVILRGLWIGALGLRYVSGDIDYEELNYSGKFTKYLKKKVGSFDRYISRLENYCSIIFAVSFLLIFYVLALTFTVLTIAGIITFLLNTDGIFGNAGPFIGIPLLLFVIFGMFLTFIDFLTQGFLKKKKWLSKIYFPFYWVFSYVTLAFLYRPIVYNFLDHKFGRRLSFFLVPLYILLLLATSFSYKSTNYFNSNLFSNSFIADSYSYDDMLTEEEDFVKNVTIPSKVISNNFLKIFMLFDEDIEDNIFSYNPNLRPKKDVRGISSDIVFTKKINGSKRDSIRKEYMKTVNSVYNIYIDSTLYESDFVVSKNFKKQKGLITYIGIKDITSGKHILKLTAERIRKKDTITRVVKQIPFWYYPD